MSKYVAIVVFPGQSDAYRALTELGASSAGASVKGGAIVQKDAAGVVTVPESAGDGGVGFATGGLVGMLVGMLGGPLGMLLGWGIGGAAGGFADVSNADEKEAVLLELAKAVPPSSNALVLETDEPDFVALDAFAAERNATVTRRDYDEVLGELEAQEAALKAAQKAAKEELKAKKRAAKE